MAFSRKGGPDMAAGVSEISSVVGHEPQQFSLDPYVGFTWEDKEIFDLAAVVGQIDSGREVHASNGVITYTFLEKTHLTGLFNNPNYGFTAGDGASPFSAIQRAETRESVQLWDDLIAPRFREVNGMGADIVYANSFDPAQAYAYYPTTQGWRFQSDVFVADPRINGTNNWFSMGGYGATVLIHETGHALGLSHPGAYNYDPDLDLTYANYAEYAQDSEQYTIMSYWSGGETGNSAINWTEFQFNNAQTPMVHDILTIQAKYGADLTTRTGDTTYGFNSNAGRDIFDFNQNPYPYAAIYDAGGTDTIDLSGFSAPNFVDLHQGTFSSVGQAIPTLATINAARAELSADIGIALAPITQATLTGVSNSRTNYAAAMIGGDTGVGGVAATAYDNLAIAYGTVIENASGGSARDVLWGNEVANTLRGNAGNDVLNGFEGADQLFGGTGNDVFQFSVVEKGDVIRDFAVGDRVDLRGTGVDFTFIGDAAFSGTAGQLRYASGVLAGDVNGDGIADLSITVMGSALVAGDILML